MERGNTPADNIVDNSFTVDQPEQAFEAFLSSETCKPIFQFIN